MKSDYFHQVPIEKELGNDPYEAFNNWYKKALDLDVPNPNWMVISTSVKDVVNSRVVLLKEFNRQNGFVFFTNYHSPKSNELDLNNYCNLLFYWDLLGLQVRVKGNATKINKDASKKYFAKRQRLSKIGAHASNQSQSLDSRKILLDRVDKLNTKFSNISIPCPPNWGGWQIAPYYFEFWKNHKGRLHERLVFSFQEDQWHNFLLYP